MLEKPTISKTQFPIESLLSARLLLEPQIVGDRIYFLSDLAGTLSLYSIASSGGIPEPLFGNKYRDEQIACVHCDKEKNIAYFFRDNRKTPDIECLMVNLETGEVKSLGTSIYGNACNGVSSDHSTVILADGYTAGA